MVLLALCVLAGRARPPSPERHGGGGRGRAGKCHLGAARRGEFGRCDGTVGRTQRREREGKCPLKQRVSLDIHRSSKIPLMPYVTNGEATAGTPAALVGDRGADDPSG